MVISLLRGDNFLDLENFEIIQNTGTTVVRHIFEKNVVRESCQVARKKWNLHAHLYFEYDTGNLTD